MQGQITLPLSELITIIAAIVVPLCAALGFVYKRGEAKNKTIIELTKSFIEAQKDSTRAIENNTEVIGKLPETIMLHIRANR